MWPPKRKVSMCFFAKVGHHVLKSNNGVRHFWPKFQGVCQDLQRFCMDLQGFCSHFQGYAQIFRYFVRIFDESKLLGVRLHPMQPCLLHLWVQWNMKTTALFVQVYYYTSMYLVWDIPKIYVWRTVGHVQNSLWNPGLHTRGNLCPKWQSVHAPQKVNSPAQKIRDVEPEPKFQAPVPFSAPSSERFGSDSCSNHPKLVGITIRLRSPGWVLIRFRLHPHLKHLQHSPD